MRKISSTHKVIKADKRLLNDSNQSTLSASVLYIFWGAMVSVALLALGISYVTTDFDARYAQNNKPQIDTITTAGISSTSQQITVAQRRKQISETQEQKQKVNDITRIIQRLRTEQISLNNRIVQLEAKLKQTGQRTKTLEEEIENVPLYRQRVSQAPQVIIPKDAPNLNPEQKVVNQSQIKKIRTVGVNITAPKSTKLQTKPANQKIATSTFVKIKPNKNPKIDKTVVGSINLAESARFAIDLGVNPTQARAKDLWDTLAKSKPSVLANLKPKYIATGNNEGETRIVAGPFLDASDAIKACVAVRSAEAFCKTSLFPK